MLGRLDGAVTRGAGAVRVKALVPEVVVAGLENPRDFSVGFDADELTAARGAEYDFGAE